MEIATRKADNIDNTPLGKKKRFFIIFQCALAFQHEAQERKTRKLSLPFCRTHFLSAENGERDAEGNGEPASKNNRYWKGYLRYIRVSDSCSQMNCCSKKEFRLGRECSLPV